jgi:selenocysteine lyase/cysteine desulfurase
MEAIECHEHSLVFLLLHGTEDLPGLLNTQNLKVLGQTEAIDAHESIISFTYEGKSSEEIVAYFNKNGIRLHNRISNAYSKHILDAFGIKECVRLSLCHYNSDEEVTRFLTLLKEL